MTALVNRDMKVARVNDDKNWGAVFFGGLTGQKVWDFLDAADKDGWELVSDRTTPKGNS